MKLHEYQAKEIFARYGIEVPRGILANTPEEARDATREMGGQAVVKAQVHAGGRGQGGGIKVVRSPEEAEETARGFIGRNLVTRQTDAQGVPINSVLVEELADIRKELYVALTIDRGFRGAVMIASASGGMDIEEVAATNPENIHTEPIEPVLGLMPYQARRVVDRLGLDATHARPAAQVLNTLYRIFSENDLFRHADLRDLRDRSQEDALEARASDMEIAYVNLDGRVGCLVNGAGLAMATLDVTNAAGAAPANFLDVGGGADEEKVASAVSIILSDPKVDRVLVNIFGGILRCDIAARGIVMAFERMNSELPLIVRMLGTNVDEGKEILGASSLNVTFADTLTEAAAAIRRAV